MERVILDFTKLNLCVQYEHFRMASLATALQMIRETCFMGSFDLRDAYLTIGID